MASMPLEQRARMQAMMGEHSGLTLGSSGTRATFTINCTFNGVLTAGKGEAVAAGDLITSKADLNIRAANGAKHVLINETELKYVGADCGNVKPPLLPKAPK